MYGKTIEFSVKILILNFLYLKSYPVLMMFFVSSFLILAFPCGSAGKESTCNVGDLGLIPGLGRSPREGKSYPLQFSGLENSMDRIVHGVATNRAQLNDFDITSLC